MQTVEAGGLPIGDGHPPRIMGVLNVSERSPYDPSVFADPDNAATYVLEELIAEGADVVDVGLESANKRFEVLSAAEELDRLDTALAVLERVEERLDAPDGPDGVVDPTDGTSGRRPVYSIETRYHEVAEAALDGGFDLVNDVCGFADPELPAVCEARDAAVVKMASPPDLERPGAVDSVEEIYDALRRGGFTSKTIVDPAFGGWSETKTLADDRETFERLREFRALGRPLLVSINRKNFLCELAGRDTDEALPVSLAATSMAVERGAHVVRTHDVAATRDAAIVGDRFARERVRRDPVTELDVTTVGEAERHRERVADATARERRGDGEAVSGVAEPGAVARESVSRSFSLALTGAERSAVLTAAAETTGVVTTAGDRGVYLAGSVAGLERLAGALDTAPSVSSAVVEGLERAL
ncbi:MAG: dihydropteroate synthase [Halobacteriaceae archaeon]